MTFHLDINYKSLNKYGEELCGDKVEVITNDQEETVLVLSDGLGSGVKANILSTLTSKIASTMLKNGASLRDTVETILNTLPECQVRRLAYSTFTIMKIDNEMNLYLAECDNPPVFFYRHGRNIALDKKITEISGKKIYESQIKLEEGDVVSVVSDGAVHAGVGQMLNLGWEWEEINDYLKNLSHVNSTSNVINGNFLGVCNTLYNYKPGDDTTIMTMKVKRPLKVDVFTGPPLDRGMDSLFAKNMIESSSKRKIICGGTTALIASRELGRELQVDNDTISKEIPPIAYIEGFDLVTEGVLTLGKALEKIKYFNRSSFDEELKLFEYNGVDLLIKMLMDNSTHVDFHVGRAVNPAHQNPDFPIDYNIKFKIIDSMVDELKKTGKKVRVNYY
jgi:hypothetical protein